jgi:hypothetical protein
MPFPNPATQFKPGNTANPHGRPKGPTLTGRIRALLEKDELKGQILSGGRKVADVLAETIVERAIDGDFRFVQLVIDRLDGKLPDKIAIGSDDTTELIRGYLFGTTDAAAAAG